jgi:hypothetical protein
LSVKGSPVGFRWSALDSQNYARCGVKKKEGNMKEFIQDIVKQLFGKREPRAGKLRLTFYAASKMYGFGLTMKTLEDVYRYGEQFEPGKIMRKYTNHSVGIIVKFNPKDKRFVVISCWKG